MIMEMHLNKKIHELMMQATSVTFKYNPMSGELDGRKEQFDKEKFAELIVRECVDYCGENLSKTVGAALKLHFGIKE